MTDDATAPDQPPLLEARGLSIRFGSAGRVPATVESIDMTIRRGEIVGLVGESGSGKSLFAHAVAGILDPAAVLEAASFKFGGVDLLARPGDPWRDLRGREIGIVFQNPRGALNPIRRVGQQLGDVIRTHRQTTAMATRDAVLDALRSVRIPDPARCADAYPADLSGGMCQRVLLAIALAGRPALLIADEPTTGLDTTTQAAVLELMIEAAAARRMATLFITHDLSLARSYCQRLVVMHAGQVVEAAPTAGLFDAPAHPYSARLIGATPANARQVAQLQGVAGTLPRISARLPRCRFADRCDRVTSPCRTEPLPRVDRGGEHLVNCRHPL